jgi:pimeloyl-ACP methyl ester carboxylesterase
MNSRKIHLAILVLLLLAFLAACGGAPAKPAIQLEPCTVLYYQAECGKLRVYEDRASRKGRQFDLNLAVIRANPGKKADGALFLLSGGPGVAATQDRGNLSLVIMVGDRDIVLVDQRGTGGSHEVYPPQPPDWSGLSPSEVEKAYAEWLQQTLPKFEADPRFYTTALAMDDLDDVRHALGYKKIDLIGGSYGTTAAQYYLRQHENHVRSVVLLSGSVGNIPIWEHQAANAQKALEATFTRCEGDPACQDAYPQVRAEFAALMEKLATQPVTIDLGNDRLTLTAELFAAKVEDMLRDAQRASGLPRLIHKAYAQGDWTAWGPASYGDWGTNIMSYSIQCNEAWAAFSPEETARLGQGSFLLSWNLFRANKYTLVCKYLPKGDNPEGTNEQPRSNVPVLLFNGELDPIDPPANAAQARQIWPNSLSLVLPGQGHSLTDQTSSMCVMQITRQFIKAASTANLDTACLQDIHPPRFATYP